MGVRVRAGCIEYIHDKTLSSLNCTKFHLLNLSSSSCAVRHFMNLYPTYLARSPIFKLSGKMQLTK